MVEGLLLLLTTKQLSSSIESNSGNSSHSLEAKTGEIKLEIEFKKTLIR